jgi:hypothetical protein
MKTLLLAVLALASFFVLASPVQSQTITCEPASSPLIEVINFTDKAIDLPPSEARSALVLCRDRRLISWSVQTLPVAGSSGNLPPFPFAATLQVGLVSPDSFSQLLNAMLAAKIGVLGSCDTRISETERISLQVTWFGRGTRRNTFDIGLLGSGVSCSDSAHSLFLAILSLAFDPGSSTIILE